MPKSRQIFDGGTKEIGVVQNAYGPIARSAQKATDLACSVIVVNMKLLLFSAYRTAAPLLSHHPRYVVACDSVLDLQDALSIGDREARLTASDVTVKFPKEVVERLKGLAHRAPLHAFWRMSATAMSLHKSFRLAFDPPSLGVCLGGDSRLLSATTFTSHVGTIHVFPKGSR